MRTLTAALPMLPRSTLALRTRTTALTMLPRAALALRTRTTALTMLPRAVALTRRLRTVTLTLRSRTATLTLWPGAAFAMSTTTGLAVRSLATLTRSVIWQWAQKRHGTFGRHRAIDGNRTFVSAHAIIRRHRLTGARAVIRRHRLTGAHAAVAARRMSARSARTALMLPRLAAGMATLRPWPRRAATDRTMFQSRAFHHCRNVDRLKFKEIATLQQRRHRQRAVARPDQP